MTEVAILNNQIFINNWKSHKTSLKINVFSNIRKFCKAVFRTSYISEHTENTTSRSLAYNLLTTDNILKMYLKKRSWKFFFKS